MIRVLNEGALSGEFAVLARSLMKDAIAADFELVEPTPLIDPFWHTTLAPSSSEIIFRFIERQEREGTSLPQKVVTLQPCARIVDMAPFSDGRHQTFFHMVTFFWFLPKIIDDIVNSLSYVLPTLEKVGCPVATSIYTHFDPPSFLVPSPRYVELFGPELLTRLGINGGRCTSSKGLAMYQLNEHKDEIGQGYEAWGPRIELFANPATNPLEYATFVLQGCRTLKAPNQETLVLAAAIGIERSVMAVRGVDNIWEIEERKKLLYNAMNLLGSGNGRSVFRVDLQSALESVLSLLAIASCAGSIEPGERGARHQLRRLVNATKRELASLGMKPMPLLSLAVASVGKKGTDSALVDRVDNWLT